MQEALELRTPIFHCCSITTSPSSVIPFSLIVVPMSVGADQEHKTDEMHTALMEASMDGHVDVARLLLDHGAQVGLSLPDSTTLYMCMCK